MMTPYVLSLLVALGFGTADSPAQAPEAPAAVDVLDEEFLPRDCNSLAGEDGFFKVLVDHEGRNGRIRTVCVDWSSWDADHAEHGDACNESDRYDCQAVPVEPSAELPAPSLR